MKKNQVVTLLTGIVLTAACTMALTGCGADKKQQAQAEPNAVVNVVPVQAAVVAKTSMNVTKSFSG